LAINTEFRIKNGIKIVQIVLFSDYKQKGLPNSVNEIIRFDE